MDYPPLSLFSNDSSSSEAVISQEEFHAFHKIDRTLFSRLVLVLNLDVNESFQSMCFLLLLEQHGYARNLIPRLVSFQDIVVDAVAKEVIMCLHLLDKTDYALMLLATNNNYLDSSYFIPNLFSLTGETFTLTLINENNEIFRNAMTKIRDEIGTRAFTDIAENAHRLNTEKRLRALERVRIIEDMQNLRLGVQQGNTSLQQQRNPNRFNVPSVQQRNPNRYSVASVQHGSPNRLNVPSVQKRSSNRSSGRQVTITPPPPPRSIEEQTNPVVEADDRTVFLTFSKGYWISKEEAMEFFTGKFGDVIEDIDMGKVGENEQPLYALMVLKMECASKMGEIVSMEGWKKYTINGKHVKARKYIRKDVSSASSSSTRI